MIARTGDDCPISLTKSDCAGKLEWAFDLGGGVRREALDPPESQEPPESVFAGRRYEHCTTGLRTRISAGAQTDPTGVK